MQSARIYSFVVQISKKSMYFFQRLEMWQVRRLDQSPVFPGIELFDCRTCGLASGSTFSMASLMPYHDKDFLYHSVQEKLDSRVVIKTYKLNPLGVVSTVFIVESRRRRWIGTAIGLLSNWITRWICFVDYSSRESPSIQWVSQWSTFIVPL